jgi:hypothetical protein
MQPSRAGPSPERIHTVALELAIQKNGPTNLQETAELAGKLVLEGEAMVALP